MRFDLIVFKDLSPKFQSIINDFVQPDPKDKPQDSDAADTWADDQQKRGYYYDDAHGYETFDPDDDDATDENEKTDSDEPSV